MAVHSFDTLANPAAQRNANPAADGLTIVLAITSALDPALTTIVSVAIIGTNSAGSARRGRLLPSRPATLRDIVRQSGETITPASITRPMIAELNSKSYPAFAKSAIQGRRVVRVICKRRT